MKFLFKMIVPAVLMQVSSCVFNDSGQAVAEDPISTEKYALRDGNIVLASYVYTRTFCGLTGELAHVETTRPEFAIPFELSGNTMKWFTGPDYSDRSDLDIRLAKVLTRDGYGSGIEGHWRLSRYEFRVQSGTPTAEESAYFSDLLSKEDPYTRYNHLHWVITKSTIMDYIDAESALYFRALWNGAEKQTPDSADSAKYDISVSIADKHTVELRGARTGETVRIGIGNDGSRAYASDFAGHEDYRYGTIPETCPNLSAPEWYDQFLEGNEKP